MKGSKEKGKRGEKDARCGNIFDKWPRIASR